MYEFSYNEFIEDSPHLMRERERSAFDRVIALMERAQNKPVASRETIEALYYLRRLWLVLLEDLQKSENELPTELRARLLGIGLSMMKEVDRICYEERVDFSGLIEINGIIRDGLL